MGTFNNIIVIGLCLLLSGGLGTYMTFFTLPDEIAQLEKAEEMARLQQSNVSTLMAQADMTAERADELTRRWKSRYKTIPQALTTADVIAELNRLTARGFNNFDVGYEQVQQDTDFNKHIFKVAGRGDFGSLYDVVWALENQRQFYRVVNLDLSHFDLMTTDRETEREKMEIVVSFSFVLEAYFGGAAGLSAEDRLPEEEAGESQTIDTQSPHVSVPASVLPARNPDKNPFYPLILDNIPPNTHNLPDLLQKAELVSIVGEQAVFEIGDELVQLQIGDPVYLGQIVSVDPREGRVVARLNKGGIIDEIEMRIDTAEHFRQALGSARLTPSLPNP